MSLNSNHLTMFSIEHPEEFKEKCKQLESKEQCILYDVIITRIESELNKEILKQYGD